MNRVLRRNRWNISLTIVFILLLGLTKLIRPEFGFSGLDSLGRAALPYTFATAGMAIVVIAGGIDLSIAAMMAVNGVAAAVLMAGASDFGSLGVVALVFGIGLCMGAINGILIVATRVPDIVVTLAMLFVWQGIALLVLEAPGGAANHWIMNLLVGGAILPLSFLVMAICITLIWMPLRRSQLGLMIYAIGSDAMSAYRSGIPVGWVRVAAYALAGLFAALGGLSVTLSTGIGEPLPGPYLLTSVAAVVLGGVALNGGKGGILGPIIAVFILRLLRLDLTLLSVDPNVTTIIEGTIMVIVVLIGGVMLTKERRS
jgi:ribose transport system permease protein